MVSISSYSPHKQQLFGVLIINIWELFIQGADGEDKCSGSGIRGSGFNSLTNQGTLIKASKPWLQFLHLYNGDRQKAAVREASMRFKFGQYPVLWKH